MNLLNIKRNIIEIIIIVCSSFLCIYLFLPLFSITFDTIVFNISKKGLKLHYLFSFFFPDILSYSISGFLMGVFIGLLSKYKSIASTIYAMILVSIANL